MPVVAEDDAAPAVVVVAAPAEAPAAARAAPSVSSRGQSFVFVEC